MAGLSAMVHKAEIQMLARVDSYLKVGISHGCWQSSVPCGYRTLATVSLLAVNQELVSAPRSLLSSPCHLVISIRC